MLSWFRRRPNGGKGVTPVAPGADPRFAGRFCPQPFRMAQAYDDGTLYFCCPSWLPVSPGNLHDAPIEEVWNSSWAQAVRKSILDGSYRYCSEVNCPRLQGQEGGLEPNESVRDPYMRKIIDEGLTVLPKGPQDLSVAYDPTCNLSCPSCRTELYKCGSEQKAQIGVIHEHIFGKGLAGTRFITISTNGDPFASSYYLSALREFDWAGHRGLRINFITNGLRLTPEMWESVRNCHNNVNSIHVSVNAASPETFAINQRGGQLEKLLPNLEFIASLRRKRRIHRFSLGFYVLANNFREMNDFVALGKRLGVDSIFFGHILRAQSHTDEEFARIAVHLPGHPDHAEFLEILRGPIMSDPIVRLSNMSSFISGNIALDGLNPSQGVVFKQYLEWEAFRSYLNLSPAQAETARGILLGHKEQVARLLGAVPVEGGEPPLSLIAATQAGPGEPPSLNDFLAANMPEGGTETYAATLRTLDAACRAEIAALLPPPVDQVLSRLPVTSMLDVETGHDPIAAAANAYRDARGAPIAGRISLREVAEAAGLNEGQSEQLRTAIDQLKDEFTRLFSRAAPGGGEAIAKRLAAVPARRHAEVLAACMQEESALPGGGRLRLFAARESSVRLSASLRLGAEKWRVIEALPIESLIDIHTGHDPFAAAVERFRQALQRESAAS